jgi:hypothetical protein
MNAKFSPKRNKKKEYQKDRDICNVKRKGKMEKSIAKTHTRFNSTGNLRRSEGEE